MGVCCNQCATLLSPITAGCCQGTRFSRGGCTWLQRLRLLHPCLCRYLTGSGVVRAGCYHAGMTSKQRTEVQNKWREGKVQVRPGGGGITPGCDAGGIS